MPDGGLGEIRVTTESKERKEPRYDATAERAVLGAVLLDAEGAQAVLPRVRAIVEARDFYEPRHALIFEIMCGLGDRRETIDVITVVAELKARTAAGSPGLTTIGGAQYVGELTDFIPTLAHCESHARIVADHARARRTRDKAREVARDIDAGDRDLAGLARDVMEVATEGEGMGDLAPIDTAIDAEEARLLGGGQAGRVSTGLAPLDAALCGGMGVSDYVVLAARTSVGKSALALQIADAVAAQGAPVLYFSLEMPRIAVLQRLACQRSGVDLGRVRAGALDPEELKKYSRALQHARGLPLHISERRGLSVSQIRARCLAARARAGSLGLVVVDYLQIVRADRDEETRAREVGSISHAFQALPGELGCPVVAICTLSRKADERGGAPQLGDLRESGDIEYDADTVVFLWRQEGDRARPCATIAKQRNGPPCDEIPLAWDSSSIRLTEVQP